MTKTYLYGLGLISETSDAGVSSYYSADGLGSTTQLTDSTGAVTDSYSYDAFGAPRNTTGTTSNSFQYTGQQRDGGANRGLYFLRARSYDPALGRFLQQDPLPLLNRYTYVGNNPASWLDPTGLCERNWNLLDKLDCPKEGLKWGIDYAKSPWNQAQVVQGIGYALSLTCATGVGCVLAGAVIGSAWLQKLSIICEEIKAGKVTVKEGSRQFLISLAPSPGVTQAPGASVVGGKLLNKLVPHNLVFPWLTGCAQ